jgi:DNA-directed RNA polymerase subunit beta'
MRYVTNPKGERVAISRSGEIVIFGDNDRERERHKVPYGATLQVNDGDVLKAGARLATWDPLTRPIVSEYAGSVRFENIEEGATVARQVDDVTGLSTLVVITPKTRGGKIALRPQIKLISEAGEEVKIAGTDHSVNISFPVGALITVSKPKWVKCSRVFLKNRRRLAILLVVSRVLPSCSRRVHPKMPACLPKSPVLSPSVKILKANNAWSLLTLRASLTSS